MNRNEILEQRKIIYNSLTAYKLNHAVQGIEDLQKYTSVANFSTELDNIKLEYQYLLTYFQNGTCDPQRESIFRNFIQRLFTITDKIICEDRTKNDVNLYYSHKRIKQKSNTTLSFLLNKYSQAISKQNLLESNDNIITSEIERTEVEIFNYIWAIFPINAEDIESINDIFNNENYPTYFKELIISAIMLSLFEYYDESLFSILAKLYNSQNTSIAVKALTAVVLVSILHKDRMMMSQQISDIFYVMSENENFTQDIKNILLQLIKSWNTEKITQKMENEILPNLMKVSPDFVKKFKSDSSFIENADFEGNPEWKNLFDDDKLTKKIEEFNKMQLDGSDVFAGTFSHLKTFPFFNDISNWFLPFHQGHSLLHNTLQANEIKSFNTMLDSKFLCDSDKYSFVASLGLVPQSQRNSMLAQIEEQNNAIKELKAGEIQIDEAVNRQSVINNQLQNYYRFFKFYPRRSEFIDPFLNVFDIDVIKWLTPMNCLNDILTLIGEYCLQNNLYNEAATYLESIDENQKNDNPVLYQKIGFCYQNMGKYSKAIYEYEKYELFANKDFWTLKHLAICYKAQKQVDKALQCYLDAETLSPENINILLNIGHCYLELNQHKNALNYYYKVYYLDNSGTKALRPIAWCLFLMKDFDTSDTYYNKILSNNPSATDYLNYGHLKFAKQEIKDAISMYNHSIKELKGSIEKFNETYQADIDCLISIGVSKYDISIMLDSLNSKQ